MWINIQRSSKIIQTQKGITSSLWNIMRYKGERYPLKKAENCQKWVDWQLVRFQEEDYEQFKYPTELGLTHLPDLVRECGAVPELITGFVKSTNIDLAHDNFTPNDKFIEFLHKTIKEHIHTVNEIEEFIPIASDTVDGEIVAITDDRKGYYITDTKDPMQEIRTEDLIGNAALKGGKIIPESWHPNKEYSILSEDHGLCYFQPWLIAKLGECTRIKYCE